MKNFIKVKLPLVIVLAISVLFTALAVIFSVSQTVPATYYKTGDYEDRNYYSALVYKVDLPENHELDSIWINLGSTDKTQKLVDGEMVYEEYVEIFAGRAKKTSDNFSYLTDKAQGAVNASFKVENTEEGVKAGRWQKLYDYNTPADATYYIIATLNAVEINELAFVGVVKDGTDGAYKNEKVLLNVTALGSGLKGLKDSSSESWYKGLEHNSNILDMTEYGVKQASKLIDEQSAFKPEKIVKDAETNKLVYVDDNVIANKELSIAKTVNSIYSGNASSINETENPVGLILVSLSTLIFGTTTFTLRLVPMLFAIGTIILAYFTAKKIIKNEYICAGISGAIAIIDFFLIITTAFTWAIGIFFIVLAIYFVLRYFLLKKLKSNDFITYLVLGGLSYALAIGVKTLFMFVSPVLFVAVGYIIYNRYQKAIKKTKDGNVRIARLNTYREIACAVISFIVIPVIVLSLSFLVVAPALSNVYGGGLFKVASKHFFAIF